MAVTVEFLPFEEVTRAKASTWDRLQFHRGFTSPFKRPPGSGRDRLCRHHWSPLAARARGGKTTSNVSSCRPRVRSISSRNSSSGRNRWPRDSRELPKPRPDEHRRCSVARQARAGRIVFILSSKGGPCNQQIPRQGGWADPEEIAKLAVISRFGRFRVHRREADFLIDGRGLSHFARGRFEFVAREVGGRCCFAPNCDGRASQRAALVGGDHADLSRDVGASLE